MPKFHPGPELLTVTEMGQADQATIQAGTPGIELMETAGLAVADAYAARFGARPALVLVGPGNNGGDGLVAGRILKNHGVPVRMAALLPLTQLRGDAAIAAERWAGDTEAISEAMPIGDEAVIDSLFGAGLARDIDGMAHDILSRLLARHTPSVAVDVPSGVDGNTGQIRGIALPAETTVSFFRAKPGHLLFPGRQLCGQLQIADIGIPAHVLDTIQPTTFRNEPRVWADHFPVSDTETHKYRRGHGLVVSGGPAKTGATRLAARAALRNGAGLITVLAPEASLPELAAQLTAVMVQPIFDNASFARALADPRRTAVLLGPGGGVSQRTANQVLRTLQTEKAVVLDADALSVFAGDTPRFFSALRRPAVLTPHEGEFHRLFDGHIETNLDRLQRTRSAAQLTGVCLLLKGPDTVIASPDGNAYINDNAPAHLATAGSGDVLAGMILGLLTAGMPDDLTAAAAVWMHGECGRLMGAGSIAEDFVEVLPTVMHNLLNQIQAS